MDAKLGNEAESGDDSDPGGTWEGVEEEDDNDNDET